jgi:HupE / UreJ protein
MTPVVLAGVAPPFFESHFMHLYSFLRRFWPALLLLVPMLALAHGISDADRQSMLDGGYIRYIGLGASHMLTGYDHLLFLLGVVFFLTRFKDVATFVTVFTLGHCITLILATYYTITWNYYLVDAIIAVSVIYKGFDNNGGFQRVFDMKSPNLLAAVFGFGLLHGFGLSTRLQQLPLGDDSTAMLLRILSFNLGVEMGQIAALTAMVGLLAAWRHRPSFKRFSYAANLALIYAGVYLLFTQLHGYQHDSHPDSFRFPAQEHQHVHEDMAIDKTVDPARNAL